MEKTLCLCMIVKNEAKIITKCLDSISNYIDYWVISDTGSTDGTQDIIKEYFEKKNISGELIQDEWVDFGYNRTLNIQAAYNKTDYIILMDADLVINIIDKNFKSLMSDNTNQAYLIKWYESNLDYRKTSLVSGKIKWKYVGVTHEYLDSDESYTKSDKFNYITITHHCDGSNRKHKFTRDIEMLKKGLENEPENYRYYFYLAQSYRCDGQYDNAISYYKKRVESGGWKEEVYYSLYKIAECKKLNGNEFENDALYDYLKAFNYRKTRLEALYRIVKYFNSKERYTEAFSYGMLAYPITYPKDMLFIEKDIHEYKFMDELSIAAYYVGFYKFSYNLTKKILDEKKYPPDNYARLHKNLNFSLEKIVN